MSKFELEADTFFLNSEALNLAAALTATLAREAKIACLFIKGPPAVAAGLRPARPSADIDVLVHPGEVNRLIDLLSARGWALRPFVEGIGVPKHSHTAYHPNWPVDLDIHFRFPGLEADPVEVFRVLATTASNHNFAGVDGRVPSDAGMLTIQIVHALRYWNEEGKFFELAQNDYDFIANQKKPVSWDELFPIIDGTNAWAALQPYLLENYPEEVNGFNFPTPSEDWSSRTSGIFAGKLRTIAFVNAPFREKPNILFRSLFPSREDLASGHLPIMNANKWTVTKYRIIRLVRFALRVPYIFRRLVGNR